MRRAIEQMMSCGYAGQETMPGGTPGAAPASRTKKILDIRHGLLLLITRSRSRDILFCLTPRGLLRQSLNDIHSTVRRKRLRANSNLISPIAWSNVILYGEYKLNRDLVKC